MRKSYSTGSPSSLTTFSCSTTKEYLVRRRPAQRVRYSLLLLH